MTGCITPKLDVEEARKMRDQGVPIPEIAARFNAKPTTVYRASYRLGWGRHPLSADRHGPKPVPIADRFWKFVQKSEGCWEWTGYRNRKGYGTIQRDGSSRGVVFAHRVAYEMLVGPIPSGSCLLHSCDNAGCVNPAHLSPGTRAENNRQMIDRGRACFFGRRP